MRAVTNTRPVGKQLALTRSGRADQGRRALLAFYWRAADAGRWADRKTSQ